MPKTDRYPNQEGPNRNILDQDIPDRDTVGVIGLGAWGTALGIHLTKKGSRVIGWTRTQDQQDQILSSGENQQYLPGVKLGAGWSFTLDIAAALACPICVITVPTKYLESLSWGEVDPSTILVCCSKGLTTSGLTSSSFFRTIYPDNPSVVLSGPSFAADLANERLVSIVAASRDQYSRNRIAAAFGSDNFRVYTSEDVIGVELGGILKNIIALGVGISDGMKLGDSARAAIITRGIVEIRRFATSKGASTETLHGLSGLGDLLMTATSDLSRNRRFGMLLGEGLSVAEAVAQNLTVEALTSTQVVAAEAQASGIEMPITQVLADVLQGLLTPQEGVSKLSRRPQKSEF